MPEGSAAYLQLLVQALPDMGAHAQNIREGDWFITKDSKYNNRNQRRPECFEYITKPEDGWWLPAIYLKVSQEPLPLSTYIGPVHGRPEFYNGYVTVRVPSFWEKNRLVWVNVAKNSVSFATKVSDDEIACWKANGWSTWIFADPDR